MKACFVLLCCVWMVCLFGCAGSEVVRKNVGGELERNSAALTYELSCKKWCTNDEACSLVLHLVDGDDTCRSFTERVELLKDKKLVKNSWRLCANEPVTKGTLAYMVCGALEIEGGLMMKLLPCRRYAYRDAVSEELISRGSENEPMTGPDAVGVLGRAARR